MEIAWNVFGSGALLRFFHQTPVSETVRCEHFFSVALLLLLFSVAFFLYRHCVDRSSPHNHLLICFKDLQPFGNGLNDKKKAEKKTKINRHFSAECRNNVVVLPHLLHLFRWDSQINQLNRKHLGMFGTGYHRDIRRFVVVQFNCFA